MSDSFDHLRIRQLDRTLEPLGPLLAVVPPQKGWLKAIREALGVTMEQMSVRLGVTKSMVSKYEKSEAEGTIKLATLRRAARALDSELRRRSGVISVAFLKELHRRMFDRTWGWAGKFRTADTNLHRRAQRAAVRVPELLMGLR